MNGYPNIWAVFESAPTLHVLNNFEYSPYVLGILINGKDYQKLGYFFQFKARILCQQSPVN